MVKAFILIMSKTGKEKEVVRDLLRIQDIKEASLVYGDYDIVAKIESANMDDLNALIVNQVRKIPNVTMTTTLIGA